MAPLPTLPQPTRDAIFAHYEAKQDSGFRAHLGASIIGTSCERSLWYSFRWATRAIFSGRLLRLFERGHMEEARFVSALRAIGATVMTIDPNTGQQWEFRDDTQHFGGSADAVAFGLPEAPQSWAGIEMKTHGDKSFRDLVAKGVQTSKPMHWAQMQTYGYLGEIDRFLYLAVNKNDDDLYAEWIHIDPAEGARLVAKAKRIINAPVPLSRIAHTEGWYECRLCSHHAVCWDGALPERHCRSCMNSTPVADGQWHCARFERLLTLAEQKMGCADHRYLPQLVAGEQTDAAKDGSWIEYKLSNGNTWMDEGK